MSTVVASPVAQELVVASRRLVRAAAGVPSWQGSAAEGARRLWAEQARHLEHGAQALWAADAALRAYREEAALAERALDRAMVVLAGVTDLQALLDPEVARSRAQAQRQADDARAALDEAARRLAAALAEAERAAALPLPAPGPCAPPPPVEPDGWPRVVEVVFGSSEPVFYDLATCTPVYLREAGPPIGPILRGNTKKLAELTTRRAAIDEGAALARSAKNLDGFQHSLRHSSALFGRRAQTAGERDEWAELIGAALQSKKVFAYRGGSMNGVGRLHRVGRHSWALVTDPQSEEIISMVRLNPKQLAAVLDLLRLGGR